MVGSSHTHLLNVNGDAANRELISRTLQIAGFHVAEATSGTQALNLIRAKPELVILDVTLPDVSAFEVCRRIKSDPETASTIVLYASAGSVSSEKRVEALDSGADGYLVQPMDPPELVATVRSLLRIRRAEEQALLAARQWQTTFDAISDGVCLLDDHGRIVRTNTAFNDLIGRSTYGLRGESFQAVVESLFAISADASLKESLETRARVSKEVTAADRTFRLAIDPIVDDRHALANFVCILTDITEKKKAYEAMRLSEARFRRIADSNVIGIFFTTLDGQITDANDSFLRMSGYDRSDIETGRLNVAAITPEEHLPRTLAARDELLERSFFSAFEKEHVYKDGRRVPVLAAGAFVDDARDSVVTFVLDVTERKQLEAELRSRVAMLAESDRRKDEFLAMLAHELRNPLSAILTSLYLQDRIGAPDERNVKLRATVARQAKHLARLVDDLLEVSRVTRGKIQLKRERLDLTQAIRQVIGALRVQIEKSQHSLELTLPESAVWVEADPTRVEQVVANLVNNAVKYSDPGGAIRITLAAESEQSTGWAVVRVKDQGIGIPPEMLPHIFDLFVQVDQSLARAQGGLGIGLTMVRNLVELHGGRVQAFSEGTGRGSEFAVRIPLHVVVEQPASLIVSDSQPPNVSGPPGVLDVIVIEDNADARDTIAELLELNGFRVRSATNGTEGLELMQAAAPDAAIIDIGMSGLNGYEVAEEVRRRVGGDRIHLIAMTGYGRPEDRERSAQAGFDLHVVKPVDGDELLRLLQELPVPRLSGVKASA